ncbi:MAG: hypothetical protein CL820_05220 [Croceicoccus sp.]|nr:hypothetical protein [Croceicoccus sp.]MAL25290.1 hypothetical protein [Croceicoccus sp.]|tara:strand:+ start:22121 stop:22387 length:267 start_codon:yes stop_codon:yes gene_type:complete
MDPFGHTFDSASDPARNHAAVTTHNTNALPDGVAKALYVGTGGDVKLRASNASSDVTFKNVPSGCFLPVRTEYVRTTGTTAADMVALY